MSPPVGRSDLFRSRLLRFTRMLPGVAEGEPRAVHRARVASRRLRELLPLLQLDSHTAQKLGKRLRKVTRRLAGARELDAILKLLDGDLVTATPLAQSRLRLVLAARREKARARLAAKPLADDLQRIARKLETAAERLDKVDEPRSTVAGAVDRQWRWAVDARVAHRAGKLRTAIADAGAVYLPERLHVVRIALKKLRYGLEVAVQADGLKDHSDLRNLRQTQRVLGQMRDLQVLADYARQVQATVPSGRSATSGTLARLGPWRELDGLIRSLEDECRRQHARFMRQRERLLALGDRLRAVPAHRAPKAGRHTGARRAG